MHHFYIFEAITYIYKQISYQSKLNWHSKLNILLNCDIEIKEYLCFYLFSNIIFMSINVQIIEDKLVMLENKHLIYLLFIEEQPLKILHPMMHVSISYTMPIL